MLGKRLGVDLGAGTLRVVVRGEGQIVAEPSLVARHRRRGYAAAGLDALELAGDPDMELVRPIRGAAIIDRDGLAALLQRVINRAAGRQRIFRPDVLIAVSPQLSDADRLTILETCAHLGTRTASLIDSPTAAALGAGHSFNGPRAHLVGRPGRRDHRRRLRRRRGDHRRARADPRWGRAANLAVSTAGGDPRAGHRRGRRRGGDRLARLRRSPRGEAAPGPQLLVGEGGGGEHRIDGDRGPRR